VKPWAATFIRVFLVLVAIGLGLVGLLMSACGGLLLIGGVKQGSMLIGGLACLGACVGLMVGASKASHRVLEIAFIVCLALLAAVVVFFRFGLRP
jgi:hypothetical protein